MQSSRSRMDVMDALAAELEPVRSETLTERLVRQIKSWVIKGVVQPGEKLPPERKLAEMLDVSRPSLRQALKGLQVMGVLEVKHGSGNTLASRAETILSEPPDLLMPLHGLSFAEMFEARRAMEAEAAACAALRGSGADLRKLQAAVKRMRANLDDPNRYFRHDVTFHRQIALAAGNSVFVWFLEIASKVLRDAWLGKAKGGNSRRTFGEHQKILEAIEARDPEAARTAMWKHLMLSKFYANQHAGVELRVVTAHSTTPNERTKSAKGSSRKKRALK